MDSNLSVPGPRLAARIDGRSIPQNFCVRRRRDVSPTDPDQGERRPFVRLIDLRSAVPRRAALMSYKDLLVVLDPGLQARGRIELAAALAERFAAHLVGLYPLPVPQPPRELGYFDPATLEPFFHELREQALAA